jgi:hypothetical protein
MVIMERRIMVITIMGNHYDLKKFWAKNISGTLTFLVLKWLGEDADTNAATALKPTL